MYRLKDKTSVQQNKTTWRIIEYEQTQRPPTHIKSLKHYFQFIQLSLAF